MTNWHNNRNSNLDYRFNTLENNITKDQEIKILKIKNKRKIYTIFYLIFGFSSLIAIFYLRQNKIVSNVSSAISDKIESSDLIDNNSSILNDNNDTAKECSATEIYKKCSKSVVGIVVRQGKFSIFETQGSGVIIKPDGYILTNNHVIESCCSPNSELFVILDENSDPIKATLIGRDEILDLAVIKVNKNDLPVIKIGESSDLCEGQRVFAIGNPQGLQRSMTDGIISALNRKIDDNAWGNSYIQTNANINPGNSGGALLNSCGQLIGINTAKLDKSEGIGFAIPSSIIKKVLDSLIKNGHVSRPAIGISVSQNLVIKSFSKNSDLKKFAKKGDTIIGVNGKPIKTSNEIIEEIKEKSIGDKISISIQDSSSKKIFAVNIELKELENF